MIDSPDAYREQVRSLRLFDARCWMGSAPPPRLQHEPRAASADELLSLLDCAGIERAVVFHTLAVHSRTDEGNEIVLREATGRTRLVPGAALATDRASAQTMADLVGRGVRLVSLYPASHGFCLEPWCCGELLEALEAHRLPVVIPHTEASWPAIRRLCLDYPALPVLVEGGQEKLIYHNRAFYPLLRECPNLHLLLHALVGWRMMDDLVHQFGPQRLLFSSHLPLQDPHAAAGLLVWSEMSEGEKAHVAHQNLEALISGVKA